MPSVTFQVLENGDYLQLDAAGGIGICSLTNNFGVQ